MTAINIDKRGVPKLNRNGRINASTTVSPVTAGTAGSTSLDWVSVSANLVTINRDLNVLGSITASEDVIAYIVGEVSSGVLDALSVSAPLVKTGSNLSISYDASQFEVVAGRLGIRSGIVTGGGDSSVYWNDVIGRPTLANVATSGSYSDLSNRPTLATVATSGSYNDLSNKPTFTSTISGATDVTSYFTGTKALTAATADTANAVAWTNVTSKPSTFAPSSHTIASHSDVASYFTGYKALTAGTADTANAVTWTNVTSKPTTFAPSAHNIAGHPDASSYFSGYNAINANSLGGVAAASYYSSANFNKTTVSVTGSTVTAATDLITPMIEVKNGGTLLWTVTFSGTSLVFKNPSGTASFSIDPSGNAVFTGDVTAFG